MCFNNVSSPEKQAVSFHAWSSERAAFLSFEIARTFFYQIFSLLSHFRRNLFFFLHLPILLAKVCFFNITSLKNIYIIKKKHFMLQFNVSLLLHSFKIEVRRPPCFKATHILIKPLKKVYRTLKTVQKF